MARRPPGDFDTPMFVQNNGHLLIAETALPPAVQHARVARRSALEQDPGDLGGRFRWLRAERSINSVVASTGGAVGHTRISQIENMRRPNPGLSVMLALQLAYGLSSLDDLLGTPPSLTWAHLYSAELDPSAAAS